MNGRAELVYCILVVFDGRQLKALSTKTSCIVIILLCLLRPCADSYYCIVVLFCIGKRTENRRHCIIARKHCINMPGLSKLKLAELRVMAEANGIDVTGLTRAQLIEQLSSVDNQEESGDDGPVHGDEANEDEDDDEVVLTGAGQTPPGDTLTPEILAIKLQLELEEKRKERVAAEVAADRERLEIERERAQLRAGAGQHGPVSTSCYVPSDIKGMLPSMQGEDVVGFFNAFERVLEMYEVDESLWAKLLAPHLSQKATRVYSRLSLDQCKCYATVKEQILVSYKCSSKVYLEKFRNAARAGQESYSLFGNRLRDLLKFYLESKSITQFDALIEDLLFNQFLDSLDKVPDVKRFVLERNPTDLKTACDFADLFYDVSRSKVIKTANPTQFTQQTSQSRWAGNVQTNSTQSTAGAGRGQPQKFGNFKNQGQRPSGGAGNFKQMCHVCGGPHPTHAHRSNGGTVAFVGKKLYKPSDFVVPTFINDEFVEAVRDTGADVCCVDASLVRDSDYTSEAIMLYPAFGAGICAKLAFVSLRSPSLGIDQTIRVKMAAVEGLKRQVLLGNSLFTANYGIKDFVISKGGWGTNGNAAMTPGQQMSTTSQTETETETGEQTANSISGCISNAPNEIFRNARETAARERVAAVETCRRFTGLTDVSLVAGSNSGGLEGDAETQRCRAAVVSNCNKIDGASRCPAAVTGDETANYYAATDSEQPQVMVRNREMTNLPGSEVSQPTAVTVRAFSATQSLVADTDKPQTAESELTGGIEMLDAPGVNSMHNCNVVETRSTSGTKPPGATLSYSGPSQELRCDTQTKTLRSYPLDISELASGDGDNLQTLLAAAAGDGEAVAVDGALDGAAQTSNGEERRRLNAERGSYAQRQNLMTMTDTLCSQTGGLQFAEIDQTAVGSHNEIVIDNYQKRSNGNLNVRNGICNRNWKFVGCDGFMRKFGAPKVKYKRNS